MLCIFQKNMYNIYLFSIFFFCKIFKATEKERNMDDLFLLSQVNLLMYWFLSLPPKTHKTHTRLFCKTKKLFFPSQIVLNPDPFLIN